MRNSLGEKKMVYCTCMSIFANVLWVLIRKIVSVKF